MASKRGNGENSIYQYQGRWYFQGYIHGRRTKVSRVKRADAVAAWEAKVKAAAPGRTPDGPRMANASPPRMMAASSTYPSLAPRAPRGRFSLLTDPGRPTEL